jgi:hypothetical protein
MDDRSLSTVDVEMIVAAMHRRVTERDEVQAEIDGILAEPLPVTKTAA